MKVPARALGALVAALALGGCTLHKGNAPAATATPASQAATASAPRWSLDWARGAVFYQVFVRSFEDSNGDGIGDLNGLIAKLDYLNDGKPDTTTDLGVDAIWLMPVFKSPSYHGYDVVDYEAINPDYGTNADFERLCAEARKRGMRVIIDLVMNHTGRDHPWFSDPSKKDWYVWRPDDPGWTQPWGNGPVWHPGKYGFFYGVFWSGMPDLNWRNPAVPAEMARIARLWLAHGASGFRLDATRHLVEDGPGDLQTDTPETHQALRGFSAAVRAADPSALLVGENWTSTDRIASYYGDTSRDPLGDELPMSFDFPVAAAVVDSVAKGDPGPVRYALGEVLRNYPPTALDAPFLTNHDMRRLASVLQGEPAKLRVASAILLTLPGTPFVYYGEEVGLANGPGGDDREKRTPMPWDDASPGGGFTTGTPWYDFVDGRDKANVAKQQADPASLWSHYRDLIALRHAHEALSRGTIELLGPESYSGPVLAYRRATARERLVVVHNLGTQPEACPEWACGPAEHGDVIAPGATRVIEGR